MKNTKKPGRKIGEQNAELEHGRSTNTVTRGGMEVLDRLGAEHRKILVNKLNVNKQAYKKNDSFPEGMSSILRNSMLRRH